MPETVVHFQVRMPPALHEKLASHAREEKTSLNALVVAILRDASEVREASPESKGDPAEALSRRAGGRANVPTA